MLRIVIPIAGSSSFFEGTEFKFPKPLIEIGDKPMIELVVNNLNKIKMEKTFIFIVNKKDCTSFHLDNVLNLITDGNCKIIKLSTATKGAACSALMAVEHINNDDPLIISNGDQILDHDINETLHQFQQKDIDGGVLCFNSVHPKWSYVRLDEQNKIIETAEKRPISKNAIAGFYYFKKGHYFIDAAMNSIRKDANINGAFFVAPVYNEMVLNGLNMEIEKIENNQYHNLYSPSRIEEYLKLNRDG